MLLTNARYRSYYERLSVGSSIWQQRQADDIDSGARERTAGVRDGPIHGPNNVQSMVTVTNRKPSLCPPARLPMPPINAATLSPA